MKRKLNNNSVSIVNFFSVKDQTNNDFESNNFDITQIDFDDEIFDGVSLNSHSSNYSGKTKNHYSVRCFDKVLHELLSHNRDRTLFTDSELEMIKSYQTHLDCSCKRFLLNLYGRQSKRQRYDRKMSETELTSMFEDLSRYNFVVNDVHQADLKEKLALLYNEELVTVCKKFGIKFSKLKRSELMDSLVVASKQKNDISNFFVRSKNNPIVTLDTKINIAVHSYLRNTFMLSADARNLLLKITTLFVVTTMDFDDEIRHLGELNQRTLYHLLLLEKGDILLPQFQMSRQSNLFSNPEQLHRYALLLDLTLRLRFLNQHKHWNEAQHVYRQIVKGYPLLKIQPCNMGNENSIGQDSSSQQNSVLLPPFLRRFTEASLTVTAHSNAVSLLEKTHNYEEAVELLQQLLAITSSVGSSKSRGQWYLRLSVDLKTHLKDAEKTIFWLQEGIRDQSIPEYFRLTLRQRLEKSGKCSSMQLEEFQDEGCSVLALCDDGKIPLLEECGDVEIRNVCSVDAVRCASQVVQKPRYVWRNGATHLLCSVENYVIQHMIHHEGFALGLHSESSIFILLFVLLFYDAIYAADVPDVFYTARQLMPLDLYTSGFRAARTDLIETRLSWLRTEATDAELQAAIEVAWNQHENETGLVTNWGMLGSGLEAWALIRCLGRNVVAGVCERLADNFSFWSSGLPDLVVWEPTSLRHQIIEVKGPGDKLSDKQKIWIRELQNMGANVSLCNVKGISGKKL